MKWDLTTINIHTYQEKAPLKLSLLDICIKKGLIKDQYAGAVFFDFTFVFIQMDLYMTKKLVVE